MQNDHKWPIWGLKLQCSKTKERQYVIGLHRLYNYLKYVFIQKYLGKKKTWTVERLSGLTYIILAKFSLKPASWGILNAYKTYLLRGSRVCCMEIQVLEVFFPFWELQFNLSTFQISVVIIRHKIREIRVKIKESTSLLCQAAPPTRCDTLREGNICIIINVVVGRRRRGNKARPTYQR